MVDEKELNYVRNFVKGYIAQEVFVFLARRCGFRTIRYGYEASTPELAHEIRMKSDGKEFVPERTTKRIRKTPDFIILKENQKENKTKVHFVEVKFRYNVLDEKYPISKMAAEIQEEYPTTWLLIASILPEKTFYFDTVANIANLKGRELPKQLHEHSGWSNMITKEEVNQYMEVLYDFIQFPEKPEK